VIKCLRKEQHLYVHKLDCFGRVRALAAKSSALAMTRLQAATRRDVLHFASRSGP